MIRLVTGFRFLINIPKHDIQQALFPSAVFLPSSGIADHVSGRFSSLGL